MELADSTRPLVVIVARQDVESGATASTLAVLAQLLESAGTAAIYRESVDLAFMGYDTDPRELFEIAEVRQFVAQLDQAFPYWLYFCTRRMAGLHAVAWCLLPPFLTPEAQRTVWPRRLAELLERRWGPALMELAEATGLSEGEADRMLAEAMRYFVHGPDIHRA